MKCGRTCFSALDKLGKRKKVLAVPPDFTRMHSQSGVLTELAWQYYGDRLTDVLPALGTHKAMTDEEIATMFGATPRESVPRARLAQRYRDAGRGSRRASCTR